jgi:serine/threonine protein kinase
MSSPVGIGLSDTPGTGGKITCYVGKKLAEGAQGSVHAVTNLDGTVLSDVVVKAAPLPKVVKNKGKPSKVQINANSLNREYLLYDNQFKTLQGTFIPFLGVKGLLTPKQDQDGYRFLVLEKMQSSLVEINGSIAARLVDIVAAIHQKGHVLVDVKSDNFMFARGKQSDPALLRALDFGLVTSLKDATTGQHKENVDNAPLLGTPLYSSRAVHKGNLCVRRDDMEAIGLLICELLMNKLPWANESSPEAIGRVKEQMMADIKSPFYQAMSPQAAKQMFQYFAATRATYYESPPNYEHLKRLVQDLDAGETKKPRARRGVASVDDTDESLKKSPVEREVEVDAKKPRARREVVDSGMKEVKKPAYVLYNPTTKTATPKKPSAEHAVDVDAKKPPARRGEVDSTLEVEEVKKPVYFLFDPSAKKATPKKSTAEQAVDVDAKKPRAHRGEVDSAMEVEEVKKPVYFLFDPTAKKAKTTKPPYAKPTVSTRTTRSSVQAKRDLRSHGSSSDGSAPRTKQYKADDVDMEDVDTDNYDTANEDDVEMVDAENSPNLDAKKKEALPSYCVRITAGPNKGESLTLTQNEVVVLGSAPTGSTKKAFWTLPGFEKSHAELSVCWLRLALVLIVVIATYLRFILSSY